jgi:hypothetical protein
MKLADYVQAKMFDTGLGMLKAWLVLVWAFWALLVKPETFRANNTDEEWVAGLDVEIELGTGGGQVRRLFGGLAQILLGALKVTFSAVGIVLLLTYLLLSPFGIVIMRLAAHCIAWRNIRRHAKALAKARAGLDS